MKVVRPNGTVAVGPGNIADSRAWGDLPGSRRATPTCGREVAIYSETAFCRAGLVMLQLWRDRPADENTPDRSSTTDDPATDEGPGGELHAVIRVDDRALSGVGRGGFPRDTSSARTCLLRRRRDKSRANRLRETGVHHLRTCRAIQLEDRACHVGPQQLPPRRMDAHEVCKEEGCSYIDAYVATFEDSSS